MRRRRQCKRHGERLGRLEAFKLEGLAKALPDIPGGGGDIPSLVPPAVSERIGHVEGARAASGDRNWGRRFPLWRVWRPRTAQRRRALVVAGEGPTDVGPTGHRAVIRVQV